MNGSCRSTSFRSRATRCAAIVLPVLLGSLSACRDVPAAEKAAPSGEVWLTPGQVRGAGLVISTVQRRPLPLHLKTSGKVAFDENRVAHVFSPLSGRVTRLLGQFGQKVRAGQALAIIESPDLGSAWSDVVKARADLTAAEHENRREAELYRAEAAAARDAEAAADNYERALAETQRAELRLKMFHAPVTGPPTQQYVLRSPIDGEIVNRTATPGLEVQGMLSSANVAQELYTIGSLNPVWIWGDVFEENLGAVHPGQRSSIESAAEPVTAIPGTVDYVGDVLDPQTHTARFRCQVANGDRKLKPEMYVTVAVELDPIRTIAIPRSGVLRSGDRSLVFRESGVTDDGRIRFVQTPVETGEADDGWIAVRGGLSEGDRVVTSGAILLEKES